ncbi:MAG: group II truncated hemoglobin [Minicystis sp.]
MPDSQPNPYDLLGGEAVVRRLVERFYDAMGRDEPALARLHPCDENGQVARENRDRFALFLIGWLGGPQDYIAAHGHPRLRMRHGRVPVDVAMRDAWLRAMSTALDEEGITGPMRGFLDARFAEVADFMRNRPG